MKSVVEEADPIVSASDTDGFAGMTGDEQNVFQEIRPLGRCHRDCGGEGGVGGRGRFVVIVAGSGSVLAGGI
ncbi:hypothetical protein NB636_06140 [Oxalobacter aliiformigenes]|uniref:hypothetical protein n=1 Tax=Oxalobacter aliiformigenes TaxID=2946593 RepID=UPI0022AF6009|nr:hypothetical protein [Oxalobacter aliiformigenes]WAW00453.1 hypothetical protein NB636_06140 [Oxalobacter aliiformigenes]